MPSVPGMSQPEIDEFLANSKILLRLGTVDLKGDPMIHPVWYHYMNGKLYLMTYKNSLKVRNMNRKNAVYFSVDTEATPTRPNKGVKGKGTATIVKDLGKSVSVSEKIVTKYLGSVDSGLGKGMMDEVRRGSEVLVEISPSYFSTWDYGKMKF